MSTLRSVIVSLGLLCTAACATTTPGTDTPTTAPTLTTAEDPHLRPPELGLPFHGAAIVDLALLPPQSGEQWRLASGDAEGWVRIWADGKLLAAWHAHRGGISALQVAPEGRWYTAGLDGRVLEWLPGATTPSRSFTLGRPITAMAVAGPNLAISDGRYVQLWTRDLEPQLAWSTAAHAFVTGLALSRSGGVVAAAELRDWALRQGIANHPLAPFEDGPSAPSADEQAQLRATAAHDFPGAAADLVEVWQPSHERIRQLVPQAPIDSDLGVLSRGGVVYREIYARDNAGLIGRRLEDTAHVPLELTKPWVFWTDAKGQPTPASAGDPNLPAGDFRLGPAEEILVLDLFPGWGTEPPARGWRVGKRRELAVDQHHAAIGDGQGNLAVVAWARPAETGWQAPGEERPDLLAGARSSAQLVTATLEPRTHYRLWSLAEAGHRTIRVEAPWHVLPDPELRATDPAAGVPMYPSMLALDGDGLLLATSLSSYGGDQQAGVRVIRVPTGSAQGLSLATASGGLDLGVTVDGQHVLTWAPGAAGQSWTAPSSSSDWTLGPAALGGVPRFSVNGRWSAHVSALERTIVDLDAHTPVLTLKSETVGEELGAGTLAAIADDGTLALVQPFGGGVLERIEVGGTRAMIELPGAATALSFVATADGDAVLVVGFQDGSIVRIDGQEPTPIHAGAGGRIWELSAVGGQPGVFVELDDRGLTLHRLSDDATIELYLGDTSLLSRWDGSPAQPLQHEGLVAVWRPGTAMPPCRLLDNSVAGVLAAAQIERWPSERGPELFAAFFAGERCQPEPAPETAPEPEPAPEPAPAPEPEPAPL